MKSSSSVTGKLVINDNINNNIVVFPNSYVYVKYGVDYKCNPLDVVVYKNLESCIQALIDNGENINDIANDIDNEIDNFSSHEELRSIFTKILKKYNEIIFDNGNYYYYKKIEFI
jgi:hypothetical protein